MLNTCFFCLPSQPRMSQYMGNIPVTRTYRTIQSSLWVQALCCSPKQSFSCLLTCYSAAIGKCQMLQRPLLRLISVKKKWWERVVSLRVPQGVRCYWGIAVKPVCLQQIKEVEWARDEGCWTKPPPAAGVGCTCCQSLHSAVWDQY